MNRYLETKRNYYYKTREKQLEYYKNKRVFDAEYRKRTLESNKKWREENKDKCLLAQYKYRQKKHFEKYGYLYRASWQVNIIERPITP
jgi:hypothetical protein